MIPTKPVMPITDFELDKAKAGAHLIGGLVNLQTTVSTDIREVRATPHCLVYPTKGKTENPWDIHRIGDAIEMIINELCDEKAEKHDWRIVYVGTAGECFGFTNLLEAVLGVNGDATNVSEDRIAAASKIAGNAIDARYTLFDQDINEWDAMYCLMFNSNHHLDDIERESRGPWKVVTLGEAVEENITDLCGFPFTTGIDSNWHIVYVGTLLECERAEEIFENSLEEMLGRSREMSAEFVSFIKEAAEDKPDQNPA